MKVKHVCGGTMVGGAVFSVRPKWRPWEEPAYVRAKKHSSGDHEYEIWQGNRDTDYATRCLWAVDDHLSDLFDRGS